MLRRSGRFSIRSIFYRQKVDGFGSAMRNFADAPYSDIASHVGLPRALSPFGIAGAREPVVQHNFVRVQMR